jgi:signal transduction histidine kinase
VPEWRPRLLQGLLVTTFSMLVVAVPIIVVQTGTHERPEGLAIAAVVLGVLGWATWQRHLPYRARALILLLAIAAIPLLGFLRVGYQVGPGLGAGLAVVVAGLLLGRRAMVLMFGFTFLWILGVGLLHQQTSAVLMQPTANDPLLYDNWVRASVTYAAFAGGLAAAVTFVVGSIERALQRLRSEEARRREAQSALDEARLTILKMQKLEAVGRLAGGVAHDFNNVLVAILSWADVLRRHSAGDPLVRQGLDEISAAGGRAAQLTRQLLAFGRRAIRRPATIDLGRLVEEVGGLFERVLPSNIQLHTRVAPEVPPVFADEGQLHQVLLNLALNARDAMPEGGALSIGLELVSWSPAGAAQPGRWVALSVRDTGVGMDQETLDRAFEPFFSTKGELGTGLGLSTVHGIVQQSGGHVTVDTRPGGGALFTVYLPPTAPVRAAASAPPPKPPVTGTILVAEDDAAVRRLMVQALSDAGHSVLSADNGKVALELARRQRSEIDLLCTDGIMPGMRAKDLIAGFRSLYPRAQVLVCSGHLTEPSLSDEIAGDNVKFLPKPFTGGQLVAALANALASPPPG